jgi:hypothetical protein
MTVGKRLSTMIGGATTLTTPPPGPRPTPFLVVKQQEACLRRLGIKVFQYSKRLPGRTAEEVIDLSSFDPSPVCGVKPPGRENTTLIPFSISYKYWKLNIKTNKWELKDGYRWFACPFAKFVDLCDSVPVEQRNFFAIFLEGRPLHFILDLDASTTDWPELAGREEEVDTELRARFMEFWSLTFHETPDMSRWSAERASSPKKFSLHVHNPGVGFSTLRDLFEFVLAFCAWLESVHPTSILVNASRSPTSFIDLLVYSVNRNMRLAYSCKPGGTNLMPISPGYTSDKAAEGHPLRAATLWAGMVAYSLPDTVHHKRFTEYRYTDENAKRIESKAGRKRPRAAEGDPVTTEEHKRRLGLRPRSAPAEPAAVVAATAAEEVEPGTEECEVISTIVRKAPKWLERLPAPTAEQLRALVFV